MTDLASISSDYFWAFLQVMARVTALFVSAPVFGDRETPTQLKIGLSVIISIAILPLVRPYLGHVLPDSSYKMAVIIIEQAVIGLFIGYLVSLFFSSIRIGGDIIDYQLGFTQAATFNPNFNETVSPIANLQYRYAIVIYLLANGHWMLLAALERSFSVLAVDKLSLIAGMQSFIDIGFQTLLIGLQIAAPAAAVLLVTDIAFALLNRAVPQMQVFFVGMPVKIMVGFMVIALAMPLLTVVIADQVGVATNRVFTAVQHLNANVRVR